MESLIVAKMHTFRRSSTVKLTALAENVNVIVQRQEIDTAKSNKNYQRIWDNQYGVEFRGTTLIRKFIYIY